MTITSSDINANACRIAVHGALNIESLDSFKAAWEHVKGIDTYYVDFRDANLIDSTGLGMLLLLREHAGGDTSRVHLVNCPPFIKQVLSTHHFGQLFTVEAN